MAKLYLGVDLLYIWFTLSVVSAAAALLIFRLEPAGAAQHAETRPVISDGERLLIPNLSRLFC